MSYYNVGSLMFQPREFDSARIYAEQAVAIDNDFRCYLAFIDLEVKDT